MFITEEQAKAYPRFRETMLPIWELYEWGMNYDSENNPFVLFLDLIGWSEEELGTKLSKQEFFGYLEMHMLGQALCVVGDQGQDAYEFAAFIMAKESEINE